MARRPPLPDTTKRATKLRWSRFSIRTLIIVVTLVCVYLASWRLTATTGAADAINHIYGNDAALEMEIASWAPMPMIVRLDEPHPAGLSSIMYIRRYYFWYFFGAVRLPFQGQEPPPPAIG
jgi:hypothetical protein